MINLLYLILSVLVYVNTLYSYISNCYVFNFCVWIFILSLAINYSYCYYYHHQNYHHYRINFLLLTFYFNKQKTLYFNKQKTGGNIFHVCRWY